MNHGSLFSGIGGFDLAAEWMGWTNKFHCEWNKQASKILKQHFPNSLSYHDIATTDFSIHRGEIDIITGGFPCQPFSAAGKRKGKDDERYLWPQMLRAIKEIAPSWVVAENVYGILNIDRGHTVEVVCSDLENLGYEKPIIFDCQSDTLGLSTMERHIWIITKAIDKRCKRSLSSENKNIRNTEREFQGSDKGEGKRWDISESEFQRVDQRVSQRLDKDQKQRLIQMGNAIPPQVALQIFKAIEQFNKIENGH